jgi:hypothetical protein
MITKDEAKKICLLNNLTDKQMCQVIERYILDMKNIKVSINRPMDLINIQLMNIAFENCCKYYNSI